MKILDHFFGGPKNESNSVVILNIPVDGLTYTRLKTYIENDNTNENTALAKVLERGMANYWLQWYKQLKQNYPLLEKLLQERVRDNEILSALEQQNKQLQYLLSEKTSEDLRRLHYGAPT